ncbi:HIPL1 protein-like [Salvia splendens]|uniref:HIPL1 protein-like n=1 Tax=Salvia splendens TaxID=180675 RepID=UPI001C256BF7|nr:HIPL1 protein-like [Salvia splendens]
MMGGNHVVIRIIQFFILLQFLDSCLALPLCTDSRAPFSSNSTLQFCPYNGTVCCNSYDDLLLKKQFVSMNISDHACASLVKSILCSRCDQFSAELFRIDSAPRQVPVLCSSPNSTQTNQTSLDFCSKAWGMCQNVSILHSPFVVSLQGRAGAPTVSNSSKLADLWPSQADFCSALGGASDDGLPCFDGRPVTLNDTGALPAPPSGLCLEKIGNGTYLNMVGHPDGSNRAFFSNQQGKIWLATIPSQGSGGVMELDEATPFLDLTDEVHFDAEFGLLGIAFHPKFTENGRFFASFNCDKAKWPECAGRCACNSDVKCDPSKLTPENAASPCQFQSVIAEFTANGTASQPSLANPSEVRRIFTMGLPFTSHHAGQILFGPQDGHLYFMMGDGGGAGGDPFNFAQNKKSLLGKIMRLDVNTITSATEASRLGLWGNYSIPKDNPYTQDKELQKEIWALGLRNPWRCSFDSAKPLYFACAEVGQDHYEEVNLITKGGNYGWSAYEGQYKFNSSIANTSLGSTIFPVMGYNHSDVNTNEGSASITGGYFYRATTDPCMQGRYLFGDLYAGAIWAGTESPVNSGKFTSSKIAFSCAGDSPMRCTEAPESSAPALGYIFSFGEDNDKDVYLLTQSGVYRVVSPSRCNYACAKTVASPPPAASSPRPSGAILSRAPFGILVAMMMFLFCLVLHEVF